MNMRVSKLNLHLRIEDPTQGEWLYQIVNDQTIIGRDRTSHLQIDDSSVSRFHCAVRVVFDTVPWVRIEDLGSTNGTWLNARLLSNEETLCENDLLEVGNIAIRLDSIDSRTRSIPVIRA